MKASFLNLRIVSLSALLFLFSCGGGGSPIPVRTPYAPPSTSAPETPSNGTPPSGPADPDPTAPPPDTSIKEYKLSIAKSGSGVITSSPEGIACGLNCDSVYKADTVVTLVAAPAAGFVFRGWGGSCSGTTPTCVVTMSAARSVTVSFESTATAPGSIDEIIAAMPPNSWKSLPNTQMKDVCPLPYNAYYCWSVIGAWSGGAYDQARERMVIMGGGHADSWYNNIFAFDLPTMKWHRLTEMGAGATGTAPGAGWTDSRVETCAFYPKGPLTLPDSVMSGAYVAYDKCFTEPVLSQLDLQQPRSAHTYGNIFVDLARDLYCNISRSYYPGSQTASPVAVCYSPSSGRWSRIADKPSNVAVIGQSAIDASGNLWSFSGSQGLIAKYDPAANTWQTFGSNNDNAGGGMDIDRKRHQAYVLFQKSVGEHVVRRWNLASPASLSAAPNYTEVSSTGDVPVGLGRRPGFVYVDTIDRFFAWGGGRDIYTFDPAAAVWKRFSGTGDDPGAQQANGTYGRFRYSQAHGVFVLVNNTTQNVFIYKPAS